MESGSEESFEIEDEVDYHLQDDLFGHNKDIIKNETKGFDNYVTVNGVADSLESNNRKLESLKQNRTSSRTKFLANTILASSRSWICLTIIGIMIGLIAACLNIVTEYLNHIKTGYCSTNFYLNRNFCCWGEDLDECEHWVPWTTFGPFNYIMFVVLSTTLAVTAGVLVRRYAPYAAGSGISEIKCIVSGFEMGGFLSWPTLFIKAIGLPLAISSGLSVGKEGPSVHYAVAAGYCVSRMFKEYHQEYSHIKEFLVASSAAGVAVAFGSPIGGVLFSIEEIASNFKLSTLWKSYFCSLVATSTLSFINPFRTGQLVMFEVEYNESWHLFELPVFVLLGIFGGLYGILVSKYNIKVVAFRKRFLGDYAIKELMVLSSITALFCYFNEFLRLDMTEVMEILFHECGIGFEHRLCNIDGHKLKNFISLIFATVFRMFLTIVSYGCKVPCGIFVPSMAAGATFGRAVGIVVENFRDSHPDSFFFNACSSDKTCVTPGTYAFLGAAAALSGITDLTITVVVIMFELTGALRYILPTMIVVGITKIINDRWGHGAIADQMIRFNGLPFIDPKEDHVFNLPTEQAMTTQTLVIALGPKPIIYHDIQRLLNDSRNIQDIPIVDTVLAACLIGYINRNDILSVINMTSSNFTISPNTPCEFLHKLAADNTLQFSPYVNKSLISVTIGTPLEETMEIFFKLGPRTVFVEDKGRLCGVITKKDIIKFERYLEKIEDYHFDLNKIRAGEINVPLQNDWGQKVFNFFKKIDTFVLKKLSRN